MNVNVITTRNLKCTKLINRYDVEAARNTITSNSALQDIG